MHTVVAEACLERAQASRPTQVRPRPVSPKKPAAKKQDSRPALGPTDAEYLADAINTSYNNKLREFKQFLTPETIQDLRGSLPPEQLAHLELILDDLSKFPDDPELQQQQQEELGPDESEMLQQLEQEASQGYPEDFYRWVIGCTKCLSMLQWYMPKMQRH